MIKPALMSILKSFSAITDIVGNEIYITRRPDDYIAPCISYNIVIDPFEHHGNASSSFSAEVQVDCWADNPITQDLLAKAVRQSLDNLTTTVDNISISKIRFLGESDNFDSDSDEFRSIQDYSIIFTEN